MNTHDDIKQIHGVHEFFKNGRQISVGGEMIPQNIEEMAALRDQLYEETTFGERYVFNIHNFEILNSVCHKLNRHNPLPTAITKSRMFEAYETADQAGGMTEFGNLERVPEEVVVTPPRTDDGRFATQHDLLRQEVRRLLADPTVTAASIRARADRDRAFGDAFRAEVAPAATPSVTPQNDPELQAFADAYIAAKSLKPIAGFITLEGKKWPVAEFQARVEKAVAAGVLR